MHSLIWQVSHYEISFSQWEHAIRTPLCNFVTSSFCRINQEELKHLQSFPLKTLRIPFSILQQWEALLVLSVARLSARWVASPTWSAARLDILLILTSGTNIKHSIIKIQSASSSCSLERQALRCNASSMRSAWALNQASKPYPTPGAFQSSRNSSQKPHHHPPLFSPSPKISSQPCIHCAYPTRVENSGSIPCVHKSIDTKQNTSETWGFDLCFLRGFVSR